MDKRNPSALKEVIYSLSRRIIEKYYPEEINYFAPIWDAMKGIISEIAETGPDKWGVGDSDNKLLSGLGFSDKYKVPDLASPIIIGVLAASLWHLGIIGNVPKKEEIENIIGAYCERFKATKKSEKILKESLPESDLVTLLKEDIIKDTKFRIAEGKEAEYKEEKKYVMYSHDNRQGEPITETAYQALLETNKDNYLIWMDEINNDFMIRGEELHDMYPEERRALSCLIKNNKQLVEYKPLYEAIHDIREAGEWDNRQREYINDVYKCKSSLLKHCPELCEYISKKRTVGYKLDLPKEKKYCLVEPLRMEKAL
jgi:hypothetical protein